MSREEGHLGKLMKHTTIATAFALAVAIVASNSIALASGFVLAHAYPENSSLGMWARDFQRCAEEKEGIFIEVIPSRLVGGSREIAEDVFHGKLDMAILPASAASSFWPAAKALTLPGVMAKREALLEYSNEAEFVWSIEKAIGRDWPVHVIGIGWRHAVLMARPTIVDGIAGHRIHSYSDATSAMLHKLGATVPKWRYSYDAISAWKVGEIDGIFMDAKFVQLSLERGVFSSRDVVYMDDSYFPFKEAQLLVMDAKSVNSDDGIAKDLRWKCGNVSDNFNEREIGQLSALRKSAHAVGVRVETLIEGHEWEWSEAIDSAWFESIVASRGAVREVLEILDSYE